MIINCDNLLAFIKKLSEIKAKISDIDDRYKAEFLQAIIDFEQLSGNIVAIITLNDSETTRTNQLVAINIIDRINSIKNLAKELINYVGSNMSYILNEIVHEDLINNDYCDDIICELCNSIMTYNMKYFKCNNCNGISYNNKDNFYLDLIAQDNKSKNDNIIKHLTKNLSQIYGDCWDDKIPLFVENKICARLKKELPNIYDKVHYTYEVYEKLHNMKNIVFEGKTYYPKNYKIYSNSFIKKSFPLLLIPQLKNEDHDLVVNIFLAITAEHQNIMAKKVSEYRKYNINYLYLIHRIIYMKLSHKTYINKLLRFIFIQKPSSFIDKDKKLFKVNNNIKCFDVFFYTPENIYINNKYYLR